MFKSLLVRHIVAETIADSRGVTPTLVRTKCGVAIIGVSRTWQRDRPCERCGIPSNEIWVEFRNAPASVITHQRFREYCLTALAESTSKSVARKIVRFLGYDPPEKILVEHPDLRDKIVYRSEKNRNKFDPAPYDEPML